MPSSTGFAGSPGSADAGVVGTGGAAFRGAAGSSRRFLGRARSRARFFASGFAAAAASSDVDPTGSLDVSAGVDGLAGAGAAGAASEAVVWPPPVGTLSTYSFGAEVGSGLGVGAVSVGAGSAGVVSVVVSVGACIVWLGASVVSEGAWVVSTGVCA